MENQSHNMKYNISIELSDLELQNLQSFISFDLFKEIDIYYRYDTLEKLLKAIFDAKEYEVQKQKIKYSEYRCKCGHKEDFHSLMGERLCTFISCDCMIFNKVDKPQT